jgi:hypothetical protein
MMAEPKTESNRDAGPHEPDGSERRLFARTPARELRDLQARLATGGEVLLVDLSRGGARLRSERRMLPGASLSLRLVTPDATFTIAGRVVRSRIMKLAEGGLGYDVAVAFNEPLQQVPNIPGAAEAHPVASEPPMATASPGESGNGPDAPESEDERTAVEPPVETVLSEEDRAANAAAVAEELGDLGRSEPWSGSVFHITATIDRPGDQVLDLFEGNDW